MKKNLKIIGWFLLITLVIVVVSYPVYTFVMLNQFDFALEDFQSTFFRSEDASCSLTFEGTTGFFASQKESHRFTYEKQSNVLLCYSKVDDITWQHSFVSLSLEKLYCVEEKIYFYKVVIDNENSIS